MKIDKEFAALIPPLSGGKKGDEMAETRNVSEIVYRDDLYPRIETSAVTVQKYAEDLSVLPPVEINQHNQLIDGWHRWTAHKKREAATIRVIVTETKSDAHLLELAIERNAIHGLQLSQADKKKMAVKIYTSITERGERVKVKERLVKILSVSEKLLDAWLSRCEKDMKDSAKRDAFDLWLSCHTQDEIAERVGWPRQSITDWLKGIAEKPENGESGNTHVSGSDDDDSSESAFALSKAEMAAAEHATDFQTPFYNVWKQQERTSSSKHFGNSEVRWLDNLLYLYTKPLTDIVIDPFAGGGSTIDLCRTRFRRYLVSDRKPIIEREKDIRVHDLIGSDGKPMLPDLRKRWQDVRLVYLDPPYWKQAEGQYSTDPTDLANMDLDAFNAALAGIINGFAKKMSNAYIALIIQPTQWKSPGRQFTDHVGDMLRAIKLPVEMRYSVPYESQQCTPQMVEWAKSERKVLVLSREIVVWNVK